MAIDPQTWGLSIGVLGALLQVVNYSFTKVCEERMLLYGLRLVAAIHVFMSAILIVIFVGCGMYRFLIPANLPVLAGAVVCYASGQYLFYATLRLTDTTIISPLVSLKVPIVALLAVLFLHGTLTGLQICSMAVIVGLSWYLSVQAGRVRLLPFALMCGTCFFYCLSDIFFTAFSHRVTFASPTMQALTASTTCFLIVGVGAWGLMRPLHLRWQHVWGVRWAGLFWLAGSVGGMVCFTTCGVVSGNIVQSLRSVFGVVIGCLFYREYIRDRLGWRKKLLLAAAMTAGVMMYYL